MGHSKSKTGTVERSLALAAFVLVCLQATLGGLRVTRETAGAVDVATVLRIVHGCVAQAFLVILVALSVRISLIEKPAGATDGILSAAAKPWVWCALFAVYGQLVIGATMRHLGAGLAIPTFPAANPEGGWMPKVHNLYTDLNFTHTRFGALLVLGIVGVAVWKTWCISALNTPIRRAALRSGLIVLVQACLGVLVVLHQKPKTLATIHVVLGAALLASLAALLVHLLDASIQKSGVLHER
jgi:cytochrome c oxidase assembly protein subunit 15